ncbi:hypothetical protein [Bradyrhizobium ivorense]|uniref:hypothetical protein n=1 Tax=Bradyrhizobium ivorense TaxID=2511166 RepID=UPI0027E2C76E|nr:hypothetical protein [Bradyrhizobium ivorense]
MTSGSQKYVVGAPRGLKSRGGLVIVVGGPTGATFWASALPIPVAPAAAVTARP